MSYILSSDWHCHAWSQFSGSTEEGINERLMHILIEIRRQAETAKKEGIRRIYVAGDIFHVRGSIKPTVFNPLVTCLTQCVEQYGVEFVMIPGNHDLESAETEELSSAITALATIPGVTVLNEVMVYHDDKVALVPWHNTREGLVAAIDAIDTGGRHKYDLILHTGINGVIVGMPDHGWAPEELAEFGFKRVFCGHYHNHKVFPVRDDQDVISIGALTHQTWSDVGSDAGFLVVHEDSIEEHDTKAPKFIDYSGDFDPDDVTGNYVRVRGIELEHHEIKEMREALLEAGARGVIIDPLVKRDATRPGSESAAESVSVEKQISDFTTEHYGSLAAQIERKAIETLNEVRSVK